MTTLAVSVPILEHNITALGLDGYLGRVRASDVSVLALHEDTNATASMVAEAARQVEDGVHAIIFACAGMVNAVDAVRQSTRLQVIDPAVIAAKCMGWLR